ncbi:uncharacterized protein N7459_003981 [Penicillium hispanicum]|uniref:uncharacterized protein n=1 Tax=Penicillium hispanicum TaxID=1080232 RepID=UPI00254016C5|nr:uncharacterized protein N7459_003981 [Penicillium hispanicum]KAJ5584181.1 hypothetical protein N7459_003981 [Penicillium hispanicum]
MSRTPSQQCGQPTRDRPYIDPVPRSHHPGHIPIPYYQPYPQHEPRPFLPPDVVYERPAFSTPPATRLPSLGHLSERSLDPRYMLSSENAYPSRPSIPQALPLRMHHHGPVSTEPRAYPAPYEERSSPMMGHGRDYASHHVQTFDLESQ